MATALEQYKEIVNKELERHETAITTLYESDTKRRISIAVLQVKAGIWGLLGGLIPAAVIVGYMVMKGK